MLFNLRNVLSEIACVLAIGQIATSAPHGEPLTTDHELEKRAVPLGMTWNTDSGAYTAHYNPTVNAANTAVNTPGSYYNRYVTANPHHTGALLISTLYVPGEGMFTSTYPTKLLPKGPAPDWARAVDGRTHKEGKGTQHVEDGALWFYESTLAAEKKPQQTGKYPAGSTMYTYGIYANGQKPDHVYACGSQPGSAKINPSCTDVLTTLGVKDGSNPNHNP